MVSEHGLGNEVSTHGDVYSFGILLLEMMTGKRPTDNEFGGAIGLRNYVQMALLDKVSVIVDQQLTNQLKLQQYEKRENCVHHFNSASWDLLFRRGANRSPINRRCSERVASN